MMLSPGEQGENKRTNIVHPDSSAEGPIPYPRVTETDE